MRFLPQASLSFLVASLVVGSTAAQEPVPVGSDFQVSSATSEQGYPRSAADAEGNFVVVFDRAPVADGSSYGVFGRRFTSTGVAVGDDFQINTYTPNLQVYPNIAMKPDGEFVVIWQSFGQDGGDFGVFAQRFDAAANPLGAELAVNSTTLSYQGNADVAFGADGGFLVIWEHRTETLTQDDVLGQLYDSSGNPVGSEIMINTTTASDQNDPRLASRPDGTFVATWESLGQDGNGETVVVQLLDASAAPIGAEIQANVYTMDNQEDPEIAVAADGSFAVVWESQGQLTSGEEAVARIFNSDGTPRTDEIVVPTTTALDQENPEVAATDDGGFVVVWQHKSTTDLAFLEILSQRLDSSGQKVGAEFTVNAVAEGYQFLPNIAAAPRDRFIVSWTDDTPAFHGESRFVDIPLFTDGFESGDTLAWSSTVP